MIARKWKDWSIYLPPEIDVTKCIMLAIVIISYIHHDMRLLGLGIAIRWFR